MNKNKRLFLIHRDKNLTDFFISPICHLRLTIEYTGHSL